MSEWTRYGMDARYFSSGLEFKPAFGFFFNETSNSDSLCRYLSHSSLHTHSACFMLLELHLPQPAPGPNQFHMCLSLLTQHPEHRGHIISRFPTAVLACGVLHATDTQCLWSWNTWNWISVEPLPENWATWQVQRDHSEGEENLQGGEQVRAPGCNKYQFHLLSFVLIFCGCCNKSQQTWWLRRIVFCCCSITKSCPTLCNPMDCSTPGFPVLHYFLELAQISVHWASDANYSFILLQLSRLEIQHASHWAKMEGLAGLCPFWRFWRRILSPASFSSWRPPAFLGLWFLPFLLHRQLYKTASDHFRVLFLWRPLPLS